MFTDVVHYPPPYHFSSAQHSFQQANSIDHPYSHVPINIGQFGLHDSFRHGGIQQRLREPRQYTHPVHLPSSSPIEVPSRKSSIANPNASEHMLRRKTPAGTLAAGYDGRPVEWTSRPHAMKHYLMPAANTSEENLYQPIPAGILEEYSLARNDQSFSARVEEERHYDKCDSAARSSLPYVNTDDVGDIATKSHARRPGTLPATGLDSVLNQGSTSNNHHYYAGSPQVPTVLQPMWPPCLGLTSLNDSGPYGPYWPDGAFVPYRPAPLRDPRYQSQTQEEQLDGAVQLQLAHNDRGNWSQGGSDIDRMNSAEYLSDYERHSQSCVKDLMPEPFPSRRRESFLPSRDACPSYQNEINRLAYLGKPLPPIPRSLQSGNGWKSVQQYSNIRPFTIQQENPEEPSIPATNSLFKEKVHVWAHRIYLSLLTSVHQSRRAALQTQRDGDRNTQPNIYPKAPRQPSFHSSVLPGRAFSSQVNAPHSFGPSNHSNNLSSRFFKSQAHTLDTFALEGFKRKSQHSSIQDEQFLQSRQHNGYYTASPNPRLTRDHRDHQNLTLPAVAPEQESSAANAAIAAIELLERFCQESDWQWTDGILLGGCLAYGLGDYHRALKWYSKILHCDPK